MGWDDMLDQPMVTIRAQIVAEMSGFVIFTVGKRRCWLFVGGAQISRRNQAGYADLTMTDRLARELGLAPDKRKADKRDKIDARAPESVQDGR